MEIRFGVLGGDNDGIDSNRFVTRILNGYLGFAVRPQIIEQAFLAHIREAPRQLVRQHDRHRHQLRGLIARISKHHPLIAGAAVIDSHRYVSRLRIYRSDDATGIAIESVLRSGIADLANGFADDLRNVDPHGSGDLAGHDDQTGSQ